MPKKRRKSRKSKPSARPSRLIHVWRKLRLPLALTAIALLPRLIALAELTDSPVFFHPAVDAKTYHQSAREIAAGDFIGSSAFWQAPLYQYFLGLIYWIFGVNIAVAKAIQALLGAFNCYLIFVLAQRVFDRRVAWAAYGVSALYGPFIFFAMDLLAPVLLNCLILLALLTLTSYHRSPHAMKMVLAGLFLGLAQIGHGLTVALLPFLIAWLIVDQRSRSRNLRDGIRASAYLLIGFLPLILATTARNYAVDRELVLVSANVGANLYLGNHPNYDSTTAIRPGLEWDEFIQQAAAKGHITPAQSSAYFSRKALGWMAGDPTDFISLLGRKLYLLVAGEEIKRNLDIYYFRSYSVLLQMLMWRWVIAFPSGLVLPLAICWMILFCAGRWPAEHRNAKWLLVTYVVSQSAAILLFFVAARYRLVMLPICIIFAAAMFWHLFDHIREGRLRTVALPAAILVLIAVICNIPRTEPRPKDQAENSFYEGLGYAEGGDCKNAVRKYREALAIEPDYAMAEYNLAQCYDQLGKHTEAAETLDEIIRKNPNSFIAHLVVGKAHLDRGNLVEAERLFKIALGKNPNAVEAMINLGHLYRLQGDSTRALAQLRSALAVNPGAYKAYNQIGAVYMQNNLLGKAEANFRRAYELNRSYPTALNNLATVCGQTNRVDEAERYLRRAIGLEPDDVTTLLNLGATMLRKYKPDESLELFDRAVSLAPNMPETHHYRGVALASLRRNQEAAASFRRALQLDPSFQQARQQLEMLGEKP